MTQVPEQPNRLAQIEAILLKIDQQQERTQKHLDSLMRRQDHTQQQLDHLTQQQEHTQQQLDIPKDRLQESISNLKEIMSTVLENLDRFTAELRADIAADRASRAAERVLETRARNEYRSDMRGIQNESRNILRELAELRRQERNRDE